MAGERAWAVFMWAKRSRRWYLFNDTVARTRKEAVRLYNRPGDEDSYTKDLKTGRILAMRCTIIPDTPPEQPQSPQRKQMKSGGSKCASAPSRRSWR